MAQGHARDRSQGAAPPRRATAVRGRRGNADRRVRHQHHPRPAGRPRAAPPAPRPGRRPDPHREGHRPWRTCPCTPSPPTASGAQSSPSRPRSPPGCRCSPSTTTRPAGGNPRRCGSDSSRSPQPWPAPAGASAYTWPPGHRSPGSPWTDSGDSEHWHPADADANRPHDPSTTPGPGTGAQPARQRAPCRTRTPESAPNTATEPLPDLTPRPDERLRLAPHHPFGPSQNTHLGLTVDRFSATSVLSRALESPISLDGRSPPLARRTSPGVRFCPHRHVGEP